mgnify:FL=1
MSGRARWQSAHSGLGERLLSDEIGVSVTNSDGDTYPLTRQMVVLAAESQEPLPAQLAGGVSIGDKQYEPLALVEAAGGIPPGSISRSSAIAALRGLAMVPAVAQPPEPARVAPVPPPLRSQLARHVGEWVATRDGTFLASHIDLRALIEQIEGDAAIQYIPTRGAS